MVFINATESIGLIISAGTTGITGSVVATLIMVLIFIMVIGMMFGIPLEVIAVFTLPFCLAVAAHYSSFLLIVIVILIFLSALIARNFIFR